MELNYRLSLCRRVVTRAGWHEREGSCTELVAPSLLELLSDTQTKVPCTTVTCSSAGCQCGGMRYPSGSLIRSVNGPDFDGSPSRAAA